MGARRVSTNGWLFWLAQHAKLGLVLLDEAVQDGVADGMLRAFVLAARKTADYERQDFKEQLSSNVSDQEFVQLVGPYNDFKVYNRLPLKAPPEVAHANFLRHRGLPDYGVRKKNPGKIHRVTHCWSCKNPLDNKVDIECVECGWIVCTCGACGCSRQA